MCIGSVDNSSKFATMNTFFCNWVLNIQFIDLSGDKLLTFQTALVWPVWVSLSRWYVRKMTSLTVLTISKI
jgi:hypothetical protein